MGVVAEVTRTRRRPPPPPISVGMSDEDLGQALLSAVDARGEGIKADWNLIASPEMYPRSRDVLITMKNTNQAAIDRRRIELSGLKQRIADSGDPGGHSSHRAEQDFEQWHARARSFTRHVDHALQSLKDAREMLMLSGAANGDDPVRALARRLADAVDDIVVSVGDDELTPEESRAAAIAADVRAHLRKTPDSDILAATDGR